MGRPPKGREHVDGVDASEERQLPLEHGHVTHAVTTTELHRPSLGSYHCVPASFLPVVPLYIQATVFSEAFQGFSVSLMYLGYRFMTYRQLRHLLLRKSQRNSVKLYLAPMNVHVFF